MSFTQELEERLKIKEKEWEKVREEARKVKEKESRIGAEIDAIRTLLNSEQPARSSTRAANSATMRLPLAVAKAENTPTSDLVRSLIQENANTGLTPADIRKILADRNIDTGVNYVYSVLMRSKKSGRIVERGGRYFPAESQQKAAS